MIFALTDGRPAGYASASFDADTHGSGGEGGVGASRLTGEVTSMIAQVPPVLEAMTGIKLGDLMKNVPGINQPASEAPQANGADGHADTAVVETPART